jgi:hypothetical protein
MYRSTLKAIIYAVTVVLLIVGIAPAAHAEPGTSAVGSLTLQGSSVYSLAYTTCDATSATSGTFTRFRNNPLPGCAVQLVNRRTGESAKLCTGTGTIPSAVQESPVVRVGRGTSAPCRPAAALQA